MHLQGKLVFTKQVQKYRCTGVTATASFPTSPKSQESRTHDHKFRTSEHSKSDNIRGMNSASVANSSAANETWPIIDLASASCQLATHHTPCQRERSPEWRILAEDANCRTEVISQVILHLIFYEGYYRKHALILNASQYLDSTNLGYFEPLPKILLQDIGCWQGALQFSQWI